MELIKIFKRHVLNNKKGLYKSFSTDKQVIFSLFPIAIIQGGKIALEHKRDKPGILKPL